MPGRHRRMQGILQSMLELLVVRILEAYFRHRWAYLLPMFLLLVAAVVSLALQDPVYISRASVYVERESLLSSLTDIQDQPFSWSGPAKLAADEIQELLSTDAFVRAVLAQTPLEADLTGGPEAVQSALSDARSHMWVTAAGIMRLTRSSMLDVLGTEYVKLARIKGLSEFKVVWKHAFKNAASSVLTYSVMIFVTILRGTVVTEMVFSWPGVGRLVVESVYARDFPVVQTVVILLSVLFIVANFMVDVLYAYINPKIRYD